VISALMRDLSALSNSVGGRSKELIQLVDWANRPLDAALNVLDEFRKSDLYGPQFTQAVVRVVNDMGIKPGADIDDGLDKALTNLNDAIDGFKMIPVVWENIGPRSATGDLVPCSRGRARLPATMGCPVERTTGGAMRPMKWPTRPSHPIGVPCRRGAARDRVTPGCHRPNSTESGRRVCEACRRKLRVEPVDRNSYRR
jgi:hypothetical protein